MAATAAQMQQLADELASARAQIVRLSTEQDNLRAQAQAAIAASEARTQALIASMSARDAQANERFDIVDFKVARPDNFRGRREESWKVWSRQFKTYCNVRRHGFRQALEWAEAFQGDMINDSTIDQMGWGPARLADTKLYDFPFLVCKDDALVIIEHYEGLGFEAWRQLAKRFSPSGGQYELDMMGTLMNPKKASKISDLPGEIQRFERNIRTYEAKTGRPFPPEWKSPTFLKILPESHKEELVRRFQMGTRDYDTLVSMVRGFSQEAWFSAKGPTDMEVDTFEKAGGEKGFDFQEWTREASWDESQQHQDDPALDYLGARGRGGGRGGRGPGRGGSRGGFAGAGAGARMDNRTCFFCNKKGHIAAKCPEKQAGKQPFRRRAAGSLEQHGEDYEESIMGNDRPAGSIEFGRGCNSMELQRCRCSCSDYVAEDAEVIGADMCGVCDGGEVHVLGEEEWSLDDLGTDDYEEADVISRTGHMISLPPLQVDAE